MTSAADGRHPVAKNHLHLVTSPKQILLGSTIRLNLHALDHWRHACPNVGPAIDLHQAIEADTHSAEEATRRSLISGTPPGPSADSQQCAGYRFARRRAEVLLGVLNLADQDYRLFPLTIYAELPRERAFVASLKLRF